MRATDVDRLHVNEVRFAIPRAKLERPCRREIVVGDAQGNGPARGGKRTEYQTINIPLTPYPRRRGRSDCSIPGGHIGGIVSNEHARGWRDASQLSACKRHLDGVPVRVSPRIVRVPRSSLGVHQHDQVGVVDVVQGCVRSDRSGGQSE